MKVNVSYFYEVGNSRQNEQHRKKYDVQLCRSKVTSGTGSVLESEEEWSSLQVVLTDSTREEDQMDKQWLHQRKMNDKGFITCTQHVLG